MRDGPGIHWAGVEVPDQVMIPVVGVSGRCLDMEMTIRQGTSLLSGFVLHSWNAAGEGSAAILFDWESSMLEVRVSLPEAHSLPVAHSFPFFIFDPCLLTAAQLARGGRGVLSRSYLTGKAACLRCASRSYSSSFFVFVRSVLTAHSWNAVWSAAVLFDWDSNMLKCHTCTPAARTTLIKVIRV